MKLIQKIKEESGRRHICICGIRVLSYWRGAFLWNRNRARSVTYRIQGKLDIHPTAQLREGVVIQNGPENTIKIEPYAQVGPYNVIYGGNITIGKNCMFGPHVVITTGNHDFMQTDVPMRFAGGIKQTDLEIQEDVWIGANCTIIAGAKCIGKGAVIGANTVVNKPVPPYAIVGGGSVAKIIKYRPNHEPKEQKNLKRNKK